VSPASTRNPLLVLRVVLGAVVVWQSVATLLAGFHAGSWHAHLVAAVRGLAVVEIVAALLFLIPATARVGGWLLLGVFAIAVALHALHGEWGFGALLVYATAVWVLMQERTHTRSAGRVEGIAH
jgi:hypothetical protein